MEQQDYNLLYCWFVGLSMDAPVWDATVFSKPRHSRNGIKLRSVIPGAFLVQGIAIQADEAPSRRENGKGVAVRLDLFRRHESGRGRGKLRHRLDLDAVAPEIAQRRQQYPRLAGIVRRRSNSAARTSSRRMGMVDFLDCAAEPYVALECHTAWPYSGDVECEFDGETSL